MLVLSILMAHATAEPQLTQLTRYRLGTPYVLPDLPLPTGVNSPGTSGPSCPHSAVALELSSLSPLGGMLLCDHQETTASVSIAMTWAQSPLTPRLSEGQNEFLDGEAVAFSAH